MTVHNIYDAGQFTRDDIVHAIYAARALRSRTISNEFRAFKSSLPIRGWVQWLAACLGQRPVAVQR